MSELNDRYQLRYVNQSIQKQGWLFEKNPQKNNKQLKTPLKKWFFECGFLIQVLYEKKNFYLRKFFH